MSTQDARTTDQPSTADLGWSIVRRHAPLFVVLAASMGISVAASFIARPFPPILDSYDLLANSLLAGGGFSYGPDMGPTVTRGPIYPLWLAFEFLVTDGNGIGLHLIEGLLVLLTATVVYVTCLRFTSRSVATLAAAFVALHPLFLYYSYKVVSETLSALLFAVAGYFAVRSVTGGGTGQTVGFGIVLGISLLTKSAFLVLLVGFAAMWIARAPFKVWSRKTLAAAVVALAIATPWLVRNYRVAGGFVPVQTMVWYNFWYDAQYDEAVRLGLMDTAEQFHPEMFERFGESFIGHPYSLTAAEDLAQEKFLMREAVRWSIANPAAFLWKFTENAGAFWVRASSPAKTLALSGMLAAMLGLFVVGGSRLVSSGRIEPVIWAAAVSITLMLLMGLVRGQYRYSLVLVPCLAPVLAEGGSALLRRTLLPFASRLGSRA